jgi:hypothetical protein
MDIILGTTAITAFISSFLTLCLAIVIYLGSKEFSPKALGVACFFISLWIASRGILYATPQEAIAFATMMNKISFFVGTLVTASFVFFALTYPEKTQATEKQSLIIGLVVLALLPVYFFEDLFLGKAIYIGDLGGLQRFAWGQGPFLPYYDLLFFGLWIWGLVVIFLNAQKELGEKRSRMFFIFYTMIIGIVPVGFVSLFLPRVFNIFTYDWVSPFTLSIWVGFISYAVIKLKDMHVRYELSELYILAASLLLLINIFLPY